jgi:hypothetical protein
MKKYKQVSIKQERHVGTICDKCNSEVKLDGCYDAFKAELHIVEGSVYPEGPFTTTNSMDLCQDCSEQLKSLLTSNGYKLNETES